MRPRLSQAHTLLTHSLTSTFLSRFFLFYGHFIRGRDYIMRVLKHCLMELMMRNVMFMASILHVK